MISYAPKFEFNSAMDSIDVKSLEITNPKESLEDLDPEGIGQKTRAWAQTPYPCDMGLNKLILIYDGDVELLRAEAIVNSTNEHLTKLDYVKKLAGPELENFVRKKLRNCPTGEVRLSPGFNSNYKFIIHAVPPKYKPKYKTAAETALFHTYFRIVETMMERRIRTCVIPVLATSNAKSNMPLEEHCHIQLRMLRKLFERKGNEFDRIVLHVDSDEALKVYSRLFRCYFPQTKFDEELACFLIGPNSLGGPNGEPLIPERQIRIKSKPTQCLDKGSIDLKTGLDLSTVVGKTPFSKMRDLHEIQLARQAMPSKSNLVVKQFCVIC